MSPRLDGGPGLVLTSIGMQGVWLEGLTWPRAERLLAQRPLVLLPLGARTKEHGPHLPLNNDWLIAEYLARRVASVCPVVVLPTLQYGYYPAFTEYPGSVSVGWETCRDQVVDICTSLARHGAGYFYVLNTGVSTVRSLQPAARHLEEAKIGMSYTDLTDAYGQLRQGLQTQALGTHADEIETSMMLYLAPEVVRMELAQSEVPAVDVPGGLTRDPKRPGIYSPSGSFGDPTLATRDKGRHMVEGMVTYLTTHLNALIQQHALASFLS